MTPSACPYCGRPDARTARSKAENPYCSACLSDRVKAAPSAPENESVRLVGRYFYFGPTPRQDIPT